MKTEHVVWESIPSQIEFNEDTHLIGVFVGKSTDSIEQKLKVTHTKPNLTTRIDIRAVLYDSAKLDLEATVCIPKGAKNTDTYLSMKALMLSEKSKARVVPSLEIEEDDVKGGHGATIGQLDADQVYYLMSRGIDKESTTKILVDAFLEAI